MSSSSSTPSSEGRAGRGAKRKLQIPPEGPSREQQQPQGGKKSRGELSTPVLGPNSFPKEYPFNRDGYR